MMMVIITITIVICMLYSQTIGISESLGKQVLIDTAGTVTPRSRFLPRRHVQNHHMNNVLEKKRSVTMLLLTLLLLPALVVATDVAVVILGLAREMDGEPCFLAAEAA